MHFYHRTHPQAAVSIMRGGFRDSTGTYMTGEFHTGVWLSDRPLDENEGADGAVLLAVDVPDATASAWSDVYEWKQDIGYREFLVPAELVNGAAIVAVHDIEIWPDRAQTQRDHYSHDRAIDELLALHVPLDSSLRQRVADDRAAFDRLRPSAVSEAESAHLAKSAHRPHSGLDGRATLPQPSCRLSRKGLPRVARPSRKGLSGKERALPKPRTTPERPWCRPRRWPPTRGLCWSRW